MARTLHLGGAILATLLLVTSSAWAQRQAGDQGGQQQYGQDMQRSQQQFAGDQADQQYGQQYGQQQGDQQQQFGQRSDQQFRTGQQARQQLRERLGQRFRESDDDEHAGLGVILDPERGRGTTVAEVVPDSPAEEAGLQEGDEIVSLDGQRLRSALELINQIRQRDPEATVELGIRRNGDQRTVQVELTSRRSAFGEAQGGQFARRGRMSDQQQFQPRQPMRGRTDQQFTGRQQFEEGQPYSQRRGQQQLEDQQFGPQWGGQSRMHQGLVRQVQQLQRQVSQLQRELEELRSDRDND